MVTSPGSDFARFLMETHKMVTEFHTVFAIPIAVPVRTAPQWLITSRHYIMDEETTELTEARYSMDRTKIARELADLTYATVGTAVAFGFSVYPPCEATAPDRAFIKTADFAMQMVQLRAPSLPKALAKLIHWLWRMAGDYGIDLLVATREVHRASMTKLRPTDASMGKAIKPANYVAPDMSLALL